MINLILSLFLIGLGLAAMGFVVLSFVGIVNSIWFSFCKKDYNLLFLMSAAGVLYCVILAMIIGSISMAI